MACHQHELYYLFAIEAHFANCSPWSGPPKRTAVLARSARCGTQGHQLQPNWPCIMSVSSRCALVDCDLLFVRRGQSTNSSARLCPINRPVAACHRAAHLIALYSPQDRLVCMLTPRRSSFAHLGMPLYPYCEGLLTGPTAVVSQRWSHQSWHPFVLFTTNAPWCKFISKEKKSHHEKP